MIHAWKVSMQAPLYALFSGWSIAVAPFAVAETLPTSPSSALANEPSDQASAQAWPQPVDDSSVHSLFLADLLEYRTAGRTGVLQWDGLAWIGGDYDRLWLKSDGALSGLAREGGAADLQVLFGRLVAPFFDLQLGVSGDQIWRTGDQATRYRGVLALQGLAPYEFEIEPAIFFGLKDTEIRVVVAEDLRISQRSLIQLRVETHGSLKGDPTFDTGRGVNDLVLGSRIRFEICREVAPYVGLTWRRSYGETNRLEGDYGPEQSGIALVGGVRTWY